MLILLCKIKEKIHVFTGAAMLNRPSEGALCDALSARWCSFYLFAPALRHPESATALTIYQSLRCLSNSPMPSNAEFRSISSSRLVL